MKRVLLIIFMFSMIANAVCGFIQEEQLSIDGRKIHVKVSGSSHKNPYAFFLHYGPGGNAYYFEQTVSKEIEKYVTVVTLDFYGAGRSPHNDSMAMHTKKGLESFTTARFVNDIIYVADYIGAAQFGIIGHDFGAFIGLHCAAKVSDRIQWFVAINPQWDYQSNTRYLAEQLLIRFNDVQKNATEHTRVLMIDKIQRLERLIAEGFTQPEQFEALYGLFRYANNLYFTDERNLHKHPVAKKMIKHQLFQTTTGQMCFIGFTFTQKYFREDAVPLLRYLHNKRVLCVASDTLFVNPLQYQRIRQEFPSVMMMEVKEGSYFPMIEKKQELVTILKDFLKYEKK